MNLDNLLKDLNLGKTYNEEINEIQYDSRKVKNGDVFVAIKGFSVDGHKFIDKAIENGAKVIIGEEDLVIENALYIKVEDSRKALATLAKNYFDNPQKKMKIIGITGTNGKTTSAFMMKSLLESKGYKVGLIGTICNMIGEKKLKTERTTPESLELYKLFNDMIEENMDYCVMEVSSHSLALDRVYGIEFSTGVFTNLTVDHLDFHKTLENYFNEKKKLFKVSINKVVNIDNEYGIDLKNQYSEALSYSVDKNGDLNATNLHISSKGVKFDVAYKDKVEHISINIPGKYNVENALGVIGVALQEGMTLREIADGMKKLKAVPGRCELVSFGENIPFDIIVDYAHTPDGLENIIKTLKELTEGRLITIFGCGGDRDKTKRPIMGRIATELSDIAIVTSDNPRTEEPGAIIKDILSGINSDNYIVEENRLESIKKGMMMAKEKDVLLIAGKGHEDYQILKDKTIAFDERVIVKELIKELF